MRVSVSIICPVYKAEQYIHRCIESVLNQTLQEWELLLIDDGSPDKSGIICDEYACKDSRISVVHKENGGVGSARQVGLEVATGQFIIHIDPDDWIEPTMLEKLYNRAIVENADVVICDFYYDYSNSSKILMQEPSDIEDNEKIIDDILRHRIHGSCCNKLVKHDLVKQNNICYFQGLDYCEDVIFNIQLLKLPIKVAYLGEPLYHYDQSSNENSITRVANEKMLKQYQLYCDYLSAIIGAGSDIIYLLKNDIKKYAIYNGFVTKSSLARLYPEIKEIKTKFFVDSFFFRMGIKGHVSIIKPYFYLKRLLVKFLIYVRSKKR